MRRKDAGGGVVAIVNKSNLRGMNSSLLIE